MKLAGIILMFANLFAHEADSLFIKANSYFEQEKFVLAVDTYEELLNSVEHADLYYNLGNAYYRMGEIGNAVWAYEKGLQFEPGNDDIKYNLDLVNTRVIDRITLPKGFPLLEWYNAFKNSQTFINLLTYAIVFILAAGLFYVLGQFQFLSNKVTTRIFVLFFCFSIVLHGISLDKYWDLTAKKEGVIIQSLVNVYSVPAYRDEMIVFKIHEGLKAEVTQVQEDWTEIILLDGKKGWIPNNELRTL